MTETRNLFLLLWFTAANQRNKSFRIEIFENFLKKKKFQ